METTREQIKHMVKLLALHEQQKDFIRFKGCIGKRKGVLDRETTHRELERNLEKKIREFQRILLASSDVWLIDYTSMSATILKEKRNRFLLDSCGNYFIKGYVVGLNVVSREIRLIETQANQLTARDILRLKRYLPEDSILLTDKQHNEVVSVPKSLTQLIEIYFGGLKTSIYRELREYQAKRKNQIVTDMSFDYFNSLYENKFSKLGWKIYEKMKPMQQHKKI